MTKSELIEIIAYKNQQLPPKDIEMAVNLLMDEMVNQLVNDGRIEIRGFGSFSVRVREPRMSRNPKTGEKVALDFKRAIHFKPGKELKNQVDESKDSVRIMDMS